MSASTRTAQRTLGTSQLGGMIVLLAVLAIAVAAIAFGSLNATKAEAPAAGAGANPVVDLVPRHEISAPKATNPEPVPGYWRPDASGTWIFVPFNGTGQSDMSGGLMFQPAQAGDPVKGGPNDERLRAR